MKRPSALKRPYSSMEPDKPAAAEPNAEHMNPGKPFWYKFPRCTWGVMCGKKQVFSASWRQVFVTLPQVISWSSLTVASGNF